MGIREQAAVYAENLNRTSAGGSVAASIAARI